MEAGNITKAAEKLNIAQTALGLQIRNLEATLGVELLVRHSRGITTTEAGRVLYERGREILQLLDMVQRDVSAFRRPTLEHVSIGLTASIMRLIGADLLVRARTELPDLSVRLVEELSFVQVDLLMRNEIDFALAYDIAEGTVPNRQPLLEEKVLFITAADGPFPPGPVQFKDVVASNLALASDRDIIWHVVHRAAKTSTLPVNISFTIQSLETIKTLVARGLASSVVPYGVIADEIARGVIKAHAIESPVLTRSLYLASAPERPPLQHEAALLAFIDSLVEKLAERIGEHATIVGKCSPAAVSVA